MLLNIETKLSYKVYRCLFHHLQEQLTLNYFYKLGLSGRMDFICPSDRVITHNPLKQEIQGRVV